jgi:hypothetical protein
MRNHLLSNSNFLEGHCQASIVSYAIILVVAGIFAGLGVRGAFHAKVMHIWSRALVYMLLAIFNPANEDQTGSVCDLRLSIIFNLLTIQAA